MSRAGNETLTALVEGVRRYDGPPVRIMEVCGTHTAENFRQGVRSILPPAIRLVSGPGCPVCVTPAGFIYQAVELAKSPDVILTSFGDLLRVPGSESSLAGARAQGADVRVVYSPLDAVEIAAKNPKKQVVFLSVGFETTTPSSCLAIKKAERMNDGRGLSNFSLLCANKTMPQAYYLLRGSADAFLYPGHVSVITGTGIYEQLRQDGISGVVAGFTAAELLTALTVILEKLKSKVPFAINCYPRVVTKEGNPQARALVSSYMQPCDAAWRGLGVVKGSGLRLRGEYAQYDATAKFELDPTPAGRDHPACRCGEVLRGDCEPTECSCYGKLCTPEHPVGACMVSSEGACAAYYHNLG